MAFRPPRKRSGRVCFPAYGCLFSMRFVAGMRRAQRPTEQSDIRAGTAAHVDT